MEFKYRKAPVKPERGILRRSEHLSIAENLYELFEYFNNLEVDFKKVAIVYGYDCDFFEWESLETDRELNVRMEKYNKELENYNKWYSVNKDKIEQYEAEQKIKDEEQEIKRKKLLKQQKDIQKELEKLGVK